MNYEKTCILTWKSIIWIKNIKKAFQTTDDRLMKHFASFRPQTKRLYQFSIHIFRFICSFEVYQVLIFNSFSRITITVFFNLWLMQLLIMFWSWFCSVDTGRSIKRKKREERKPLEKNSWQRNTEKACKKTTETHASCSTQTLPCLIRWSLRM